MSAAFGSLGRVCMGLDASSDHFRRRGIRDRLGLVYATPLDGAFTRPIAAHVLGSLLASRNIHVEAEFAAAEVDGARRGVRFYNEREVPYDLLVSVPTPSGAVRARVRAG